MPTGSRRIAWNWGIFAVVLAAVLAKNAGLGMFQQTEELLLLPADQRGQTTEIEIGWPFTLLYTEAYQFQFQWGPFDSPMPVGDRVIYIALDVAVAVLLTFTATRYLSLCVQRCGWQFNLLALLAGVSVIATLIADDMRNWFWRGGVGAITWSLFRCVEFVILFGIATSWYWLLTVAGEFIGRLLGPPDRQA